MKQYKRALVIGASSGIGRALTEQLLAEGAFVALVGRNRTAMEAIEENLKHPASSPAAKGERGKAFIYPHDVRNYSEVPALFQQVTHDLGGLDLVIYNSGVMFTLDEHEYSFEKDREVIEVNVLGAFAWFDEAAKRFEQTRGGTIVGISSVAGDRGRRGNPAYGTSKAALTTFLESLRNRLSRFGVKVVTIKPGFIDTEMTRGKPGLFWLITPDEAAKQILHAARSGKSTAYIPGRWRAVSFVLRSIPSFIFKHLPV
ncbi:MAG: SDR family NAD(P)-dependent oxidoreductase [Bacteroidota bacterium]|nr:SDR family NAD(P)-dependent oxidoreductase [Bacteroidota bacterium]MDP4232573.1 SDR family NAD(P)-dependent oxidoreductase [Bacteroidota bacterium]MDP4242973.1 SDR family NAD(P)-dependent oxidoreductase [Bacteroidota bacterium]MDP4286452.1 SDR family NAD(P)-dependent oxidoreductase [Bacteroidota bacterium]